MTALFAYIFGVLTPKIGGMILGAAVTWVVKKTLDSKASEWPRVTHYAQQHDGKSYDCPICNPKPPEPPVMDSLSSQ